MGSGYYGELSLGNERGTGSSSSSSSSSSSRRGKKGGSDKQQPRQPQRGLGVAQLEKIRLHGEIASAAFHPTSYPFNNEPELTNVHGYSPVATSSSPSYGFPSNVMMGFGECEGRRVRDGDSQHSTAARWDPSNGGILETQHFAHSNMTSHLQNPQAEWAAQSRRQEMGENCEACESQELDLELRLSII